VRTSSRWTIEGQELDVLRAVEPVLFEGRPTIFIKLRRSMDFQQRFGTRNVGLATHALAYRRSICTWLYIRSRRSPEAVRLSLLAAHPEFLFGVNYLQCILCTSRRRVYTGLY
jgi:hypothetical protein